MDSTKQNLNILTWNATGIMSSATYLTDCLYRNTIDICGISEHWLYEKDLQFLNQLDNSYISYAVADSDLKCPSKRRVGKGGVALLWHRKYDRCISPLSLDDDRIIGIKFEVNTENCIYFIQVYLPCSNHSIEVYREYMDKLQNILYLFSEKGIIIMMGDFNSHLPEANSRGRIDNRGLCFNSLLQENNIFSINTSQLCAGPRSTFVTYDGRHESLIDYILIPEEISRNITYCEVLDDNALNVSRHRPVFCTFELPYKALDNVPVYSGSIMINWRKCDQPCIDEYQNILKSSEHMTNITHSDIDSKSSIDQTYTTIIKELTVAAQKCFPHKSYKRFLKPYWNTELRDLHYKMKKYREAWVRKGKPRESQHITYIQYKMAKRQFRHCHRKCVNTYLQSQLDEIDRLAEVDSAHFWRLVNARRKPSNSSPGTQLIFEGQTVNTSKEINEGWAQYFKALYTPTQCDRFDNQVYDTVTQEVSNIKRALQNSTESRGYPLISADEVASAVKLTKSNKAGGEDGIVYEHIKYGGCVVFDALAKFYTAIVRQSYAPKDMKRGVIITLFKGGNKRKDNPDNYRAITLSSVVLKLLERILLTRIELFDNIRPPIHSLQGGFKKQQGCLMSSFLVREAIQYAQEKGSKVYACFLDVKKAFDQVWHDGLFYKLHNCGVNTSVLSVIINLYTDMESCVKTQYHKSGWFPVRQGTRQGGVLSPFLYLVYDNDLIWELEESKMGMYVHGIYCGSPAVADDKLVLSLSKQGMDRMIKICYNHSGIWRYELQPPKCVVIVFNESPLDYRITTRTWALGNAYIEENILYKHLGVVLNKYGTVDDNVKEAASKLKGTFLSLINSGVHEGGLNPITSKSIYKAVVLPKALYGCELWYSLQSKHIDLLEKAHKFCVKFMQSLPRRTSTDLAFSLLNIKSILYDIEYRKLIFFGQLCNLPPQYCVKEMFIHRLLEFKSQPSSVKGYFSDIYRLLGKYSLLDAFNGFENDGIFMSKFSWRRLVRANMETVYEADRCLKSVNSENAKSVMRITEPNREYLLWDISREIPKYLPFIQRAVRLLGTMFSGEWIRKCYLCGENILTSTEHVLLFCRQTENFRESLWCRLIYRFGMTFFHAFISEPPRTQLEMLYSGCSNILKSKTDVTDCVKLFVTGLAKIQSHSDIGIVF